MGMKEESCAALDLRSGHMSRRPSTALLISCAAFSSIDIAMNFATNLHNCININYNQINQSAQIHSIRVGCGIALGCSTFRLGGKSPQCRARSRLLPC